MSYLKVIVDRQNQTAVFSGSGTFTNKDSIKSLGNARFLRPLKAWEVRPWLGSLEELQVLFPGIEIEVRGDDGSFAQPDASVATRCAITEASTCKESPTLSLAVERDGGGSSELPKLSVSALVNQVQRAVMQVLPTTFCVFGCLAQVKRQQGRVFLELADEQDRDSYVSCVIWADEARLCRNLEEAGFHLEPDLQVMFVVSAQVNKRGARISLRVDGVVAEYTLQKFAALREVTNKRLRQEGLFDRNREAVLSFLPRKLVLLTSKGGTVINDFCASLDQACFGFELVWIPVSVQGQAAKRQILRAIERAQHIPAVDAILIFRGGGSSSELATFNDYDVAKAVCLCPLPVLAAIGHQEDQSSVQDVSFRAFGVPKDLGRFFADVVEERRLGLRRSVEVALNRISELARVRADRLSSLGQSARAQVQQILWAKAERLALLKDSVPANSRVVISQRFILLKRLVHGLHLLTSRPFDGRSAAFLRVSGNIRGTWNARVQAVSRNIEYEIRLILSLLSKTLDRGFQRLLSHGRLTKDCEMFIRQEDLRVTKYEELLREVSPEVQLRRGFVMVSRGDAVVTSAKALTKDAQVDLEFWDGRQQSKIL